MADTTHLDDEDRRRAGRREANLRLLNERIVEALERFRGAGDAPERLYLACECANGACDVTIEVPAETFFELRDSTVRFAVAEGHVVTDVERIVARVDGWVVVEKVGSAAKAATDRLS